MRFLIALALLISPAAAQTPPCLPYADMVKLLKDTYHEASVASGLINNKRAIEIFASPAGTWTIVRVDADGPTCMLASGISWSGMNLPGVRM